MIPTTGKGRNHEIWQSDKEEREKQKMSQKELAERADVTRRAVIYWENGQMKPSLENADKIFRALGISVTIGLQPAAGKEAE